MQNIPPSFFGSKIIVDLLRQQKLKVEKPLFIQKCDKNLKPNCRAQEIIKNRE